jgi:DNA processing protein
MDALALQLALGRAPELSAQRLNAALERSGGRRTAGLAALIEVDRAWVKRERIALLNAWDPGYPVRLAQASTAPAVLYVRGDPASLTRPLLAIVGARSPTLPARRTAMKFALELSRAGLTITSGLAYGIDAAAHEVALAAPGPTVVVLGSGLDQVYPASTARSRHASPPTARR